MRRVGVHRAARAVGSNRAAGRSTRGLSVAAGRCRATGVSARWPCSRCGRTASGFVRSGTRSLGARQVVERGRWKPSRADRVADQCGDVGSVGAAPLPLTDRLERAFAARVSDLPEETRRLLEVAALGEEGMLREILAAASEIARRTVGLEGRRRAARRDQPIDLVAPAEAPEINDPPAQTVAPARGAAEEGIPSL